MNLQFVVKLDFPASMRAYVYAYLPRIHEKRRDTCTEWERERIRKR